MSAHTFTCMWFYPFQLHVDVFASVFSYSKNHYILSVSPQQVSITIYIYIYI